MYLLIFTADTAAQTGDAEAIKELERKQFEIEKRLREKERKEKKAAEKEAEEGIVPAKETDYRFFIKEIIIQNPELLSESEKNKLLAPFLNREIGYNDINKLVSRITNILIGKGFITARVKVPLEQNLKSGKLVLTIVNGYIGDIVPDEDSIRRRMQLFFAFPFLKGGLLNINDLDYGVEQMNRLESSNATMKILPGEKLGYSKIVIFNDTGYLLNLEAGIDNLGQKSTSEYRRKISAGFDNLISINDNILLIYTDGVNRDTDRKYNRSYTVYFSFPFGYSTFSAVYSRSEYLQYIEGAYAEFKSSGNDTSSVFSLDRLLWKHQLDRIKLQVSLSLKEKESFLEDIKIDTSSRKLTVAKLGLNYSGYLLGGYFASGVSYNQGLDLFGAEKDESGMPGDTPRAQFYSYKVDLFWQRSFNILGQLFAFSISSNGQYGMDTLYNTEQIVIGDLYTVRGFKNTSASGDRGYYVRNELSVNDFSRFWRYLRGLKLFTAYDYGYVIHKTGKEANNGQGEATLAGISAGFNYSSGLLDTSFTYGRKVRSPGFLKEDDYVIYLVFTMNFTNLFDETWTLIFK